MTRLVTADASRVSPRRFLRHVLGPTQAEIAAELAAMSDDELQAAYEHARETKDYRTATLFAGEQFRRILQSKQQLVEVEHLGPGRLVA